ncbi:MAG: SDR family NAD(P)-dependent oxidoreductase [Promethearchaeota archaeon]
MKKSWYKGKIFVITGASGGIGREVCRVFAPLGMKMYLLDLQNSALTKLVDELIELGAEYVKAMECDVTNPEQVNSVIKSIGEKVKYIDILHNNAGIGNKCSITNDGSFQEYRKLMSINVDGMWLILKAALPYIGRPAPTKKYPNRKRGQLIFTSSLGGKVGVPYMAAYSMSKHAIVGLAESLRMEFKMQNHKIDVITVCPAPANTKFYDCSEEMKQWKENYASGGLLYKLVEPKDIAKAILKASRKNKKEIFIPRFSSLISFMKLISSRWVENFLIKIEEKKSS